MQLFYRPPLAALGDIIPFHDGKAFRIFYLRNYRNNMDAEHHDSWDMLTTTDQLHFTSHDTGILSYMTGMSTTCLPRYSKAGPCVTALSTRQVRTWTAGP